MAEEKKDFKEVKVKVQGAQRDYIETLDRNMLYSGVNIFGQLTALYISKREEITMAQMSGKQTNTSNKVVSQESLAGASTNSMMELSTEVLSIFKRMQKRDNVTKIKACGELKKYVEALTGELDEEFPNLLTFFLYHMCRILLNEHDKMVREAALDCFTSFIRKGKRKLGPHIRKIFPIWYISFFDPAPEVVRLAQSNFELAFPKDKQADVFQLAQKMFLNFCFEQLQQTKSDDDLVREKDKKSQELVFDRIACGCLQALAHSFQFIKKWTQDQQQYYQKKLLEVFELQSEPQEPPKQGQKPAKKQKAFLWSFLDSKWKGSIKAACLQFVAAFLSEMPKEVVQLHIPDISPSVFALVSEQNSILQNSFWREALFTLAKNFPECWSSISIKKDFLPKLLKCLKEAAYGSPTALYENFVKYLSVCPLYRLVDFQKDEDKQNKASFKDRCSMIREAMLALNAGIDQDEAVTYHQELVNSYCESLTFLLLKRVQVIENPEEREFAMKQMARVVYQPMLDFASKYQKSASKHQKARNLRSSFQARYAQMLVDLATRQFNQDLFSQICDVIAAEMDPSQRNSMRLISAFLKTSDKMPAAYWTILQQRVILQIFNKQTKFITEAITTLSKSNIAECLQMAETHSRLVYTLVKRNLPSFLENREMLLVGEMLTKVLKIEKLAAKALTKQVIAQFRDLERCLVEVAALYLARGYEISEEFCKILLEAGLLEPAEGEAKDVKVNPIEEILFTPNFPKISLEVYYRTLRESAEIHDLMVGAITVKMLAPNAIRAYKNIVAKAITHSVQKKPQAILNEDDLELVRTNVLVELEDPQCPVQEVTAYMLAVGGLCCQPEEINDDFRDILLQKLLEIKNTKLVKPTESQDGVTASDLEQLFSQLWSVFESAVIDNVAYQHSVTSKLQSEVSKLISSNSSNFQTLNHYTRVIKKYVDILDNSQKIACLSDILLNEANFKNLDEDCLPLKMFKDLFLQGGIGFDVQQLLTSRDDNGAYRFQWLTSVFLSTQHMPSLSSLMELRRQLMIFVETEVVVALVSVAQNDQDKQLIIRVLSDLCAQGNLHTFELLVKTMDDPGEQFADIKPVLKIDDFKAIFAETCVQTADALLESNFACQYDKRMDFLVVLFQVVGKYIIDEPQVAKLFKLVDANLKCSAEEEAQTKLENVPLCKIQLDVYMALEKWFVAPDDKAAQDFQISLLNQLLKLAPIEMKQISVDLCNQLLDRQSNSVLKAQVCAEDLLITTLELLESTAEMPCFNTITLCKVVRRTINWSTGAQDSILGVLVQAARDRAHHFDQELTKISVLQKGANVRPFEIEMLRELAETLLVCPSAITQTALQPSVEDNLYALLGCQYESLQKAAYVLLKFIFENFVPPVEHVSDANEAASLEELMKNKEADQRQYSAAFKNIPKSLFALIDEAPSDEQETELSGQFAAQDSLESLVYGSSEEGQMNNKVFGYLLAWNATLVKIEQGRIKLSLLGDNQDQGYLQVISALTEYFETDQTVYHMMLVSLVPHLPRITKKGFGNEDLSTHQLEYCDRRDQRSTRNLCLFTLINFMKSFPSLGRKFFGDCDKQLTDIMLPYIKAAVSPAILENEIKKIELSQLQLGQKSDLTFVLFKSTKEIVATYTQSSELQCQLKIKIPLDYPLKSVQVDIGEQLKIKQQKIRNWTLSIRNLLHTRNGDIISAILLWKKNIDKEMEGVEECYICYSVMHASDKSLPTMQCRSCSNKFHVGCIRKWFNTSNKSNCPLCQNFFFQ